MKNIFSYKISKSKPTLSIRGDHRRVSERAFKHPPWSGVTRVHVCCSWVAFVCLSYWCYTCFKTRDNSTLGVLMFHCLHAQWNRVCARFCDFPSSSNVSLLDWSVAQTQRAGSSAVWARAGSVNAAAVPAAEPCQCRSTVAAPFLSRARRQRREPERGRVEQGRAAGRCAAVRALRAAMCTKWD